MASNASIVRQLPQRDRLKAELREVITAERKLANRRSTLEDLVASLDAVGVVHKGIAIRVRENQGGHDTYSAVAAEIDRWADVYPNVRQRGRYGLTVFPGPSGIDRWCGSGWPDRASARAAALEWVATGAMPVDRHEKAG